TVLRALREEEYADWDIAHRAQYALGLVQHAGLSREEAEAKVARDIPAVLPDGLATENVRIWAVEAEGRRVGTVFVGVRDGDAWLYDITIDESERGRGYGRGAMVALEAEARALGYDRIALNVWGGNDVARGLYRSLGWAENSVHMRKRL
ncbi:MAG: GNAT family N-acetyltransferase, partial [Actinobacteria bacterium]|nr:GNAT family N-acetyltransferase [Actinomycetota bacterium]